MTERKVRPMLVLFTIMASCLPPSEPTILLLLYFVVEVELFPSLVSTSMKDIVVWLSVEWPARVLCFTLPILIVMNLCLASFTNPWLRKLYRGMLFVLWGNFIILLPRDSGRIYTIPVVLLVVTLMEGVLVRNERLSRKHA